MTLERYNELFHNKTGPYQVTSINDTTLRIGQNGLENTVSIHAETMSLKARLHGGSIWIAEAESTKRKEPPSHNDSNKGCNGKKES